MRAIVLTLFVGCLVAVLMIEAFLRYDDYSAFAVDYIYHEWDGRERRVMATAEDLADPREAILILGDSMVAGINCGRERNLVGHFSRVMQPIGAGYKAINLGSANTSVFAHLDQLRGYEAGEGPPAGVIVMLYTNDADVIEPRLCPVLDIVERSEAITAEEKADIREFCNHAVVGQPAYDDETPWFAIGGPVDSRLYDLSYAYRFFRESFAVLAVSLGGGEPVGRLRYPALWSDADSLAFRLIAAGMEEIEAITDRHGIPLMVAFYPPIEFLSLDNPMYEASEIAGRRLEERLGVPVLNGFDAYLQDPRATTSMTRSLTDHHPSCLGHQILAEWLVRKYDEAGGFDEPPGASVSTLSAIEGARFRLPAIEE